MTINELTPCNRWLSCNDTVCEVLSKLDANDLKTAEQVCKKMKLLIEKKNLWNDLFTCTFHNIEKPKFMSMKRAARICSAPKIDSTPDNGYPFLIKCVSFMCDLQVDKGKILLCFREEDIKSPLLFLHQSCETSIKDNVIEEQDEIYRFSNTMYIPPATNKSNHVIKVTAPIGDITVYTQITISPNCAIGESFFNQIFEQNFFAPIAIHFDVGEGNTLGYCSNVNNWTKPFKLVHINGEWMGRVPSIFHNSTFSFVKIDSAGKIKAKEVYSETRTSPLANGEDKYELYGSSHVFAFDTCLFDPDTTGAIRRLWKQHFLTKPLRFPPDQPK